MKVYLPIKFFESALLPEEQKIQNMLKGAVNSLFERSNSELSVLEGVRLFACLSIVLFHTPLAPTAVLPFDRYPEFQQFLQKIWWLSGGYLFVNLFFITSGFLITLELTRRKRWSAGDLLQFFLLRLFRLVPVYYALLLLRAMATPQLCPRSDVIKVALFVNNYQLTGGTCYPEGWSVAVDFHGFILLLVTYKMCDVFKISLKKALFFLVAVALGLRLYQVLSLEKPIILPQIMTVFLGQPKRETFDIMYSTMKQSGLNVPVVTEKDYALLQQKTEELLQLYPNTYPKSHLRFGATVCGALIALFYKEKVRAGWLRRVVLLNLSVAVCLYHVYYGVVTANPERVMYNQFHLAMEHVTFSCGASYIVYCILTSQPGEVLYWLKLLLSHRWIMPVAKLSYCIYLCQLLIMLGTLHIIHPTNNMPDLPFIFKSFIVNVFCITVLSFIIYVTVEYPGLVFRSKIKQYLQQKEIKKQE